MQGFNLTDDGLKKYFDSWFPKDAKLAERVRN